jgi:hypothetical protein
MSDFIVNAAITVSGDANDLPKIRAAVDAGLKELPSVASRYGFTITGSDATVGAEETAP